MARPQDVKRDRLTAIDLRRLGIRLRMAITTVVTVVAARTVAPVEALGALFAVIGGSFGFGLDQLFLALVFVGLIVALATRSLILEAGAALAQHSKIMVRELQIIFGLNAVARELRVACHALVLFEQLGGIAALAIVLAVARLSAKVPATAALSPAAAPAATLSVVDQMPTSLRSVFKPLWPRQAGRRRCV